MCIRDRDGYTLEVSLPFAGKGEVELHESMKDVILRIGNFKRNIPKPDVLRDYEISSAKLEEETLRITFSERQG